MYGGESLNNHMILTYGLMKEFYDTFRPLTYYGIPLPLVMNTAYQSFIKPFVMNNLTNKSLIDENNDKIRSIKDTQRLFHKPDCLKDLYKEPKRKKLLMPAVFLPFALKKFLNHPVVLTISTPLDEEALKNCKIPSNFETLNVRELINNVKIPIETVKKFKTILNSIIDNNKNHVIFGSLNFKKKIYKIMISSMKSIYVLERVVLKKQIKVILGLDVLGMPGKVLSLIAAKYNLPFIWIQYWLLTDASMIPSFASHYCVWGENYKNWLKKKGIPTNKIFTVGSLRFENENRSTLITRDQILNELKIPKENYIITFTTQNFSENISKKVIADIFTWFDDTVNKLPITIVIKSRKGDLDYYLEYLKENKIILSPLSLELYALLKHTDFLMTISSTTALEAAKYKKGIIVLQPFIDYHYKKNYNGYHSHLANASAGSIISNKNDFENTLKHLLGNEEYRNNLINQGQEFLQHSIDLNGLPSDRIHVLIKSLL